jgi:hypothetical protein
MTTTKAKDENERNATYLTEEDEGYEAGEGDKQRGRHGGLWCCCGGSDTEGRSESSSVRSKPDILSPEAVGCPRKVPQ